MNLHKDFQVLTISFLFQVVDLLLISRYTECDLHISYSLNFTSDFIDFADRLLNSNLQPRTVIERSSTFDLWDPTTEFESLESQDYQLGRSTCQYNFILSMSCFEFQLTSYLAPFKEGSSFVIFIPLNVDCAESNFAQFSFLSGSYSILQLDSKFLYVQNAYTLSHNRLADQLHPPLTSGFDLSLSMPNVLGGLPSGGQTLSRYSNWQSGVLQVVARRYPELSRQNAMFCSYGARMRPNSRHLAYNCKPLAVVSIVEALASKVNATIQYSSTLEGIMDNRVLGLASLDDPLEAAPRNLSFSVFVTLAEIRYRGDVFTSLVYCVPKVDRIDLDLWFWVRPFALDPTSIILLMTVGLMLDVCAKGHIYCSNWVYRQKTLTTSGIKIYGSLLLMLLCAIYECNLSSDVTIPSPPIRITTFRELVMEKGYKIQGVPGHDPTDPIYRVMLDSFGSEGLAQSELDNSLVSFKHRNQLERSKLIAGCRITIFTTDDDIVLDPDAFYTLDSNPDIKCNRLRNRDRALKFKYYFIKGGNHVLGALTSRLLASGTVNWLYDYENHVSLWRNRRKISNSRTELEQPMAFNMSHWKITPTFVLWTFLVVMSYSLLAMELLVSNSFFILSFRRHNPDAVQRLS